MPLIASEGDSKPKQLAPAGTHSARCISVIDLGTQSTPFGESHKVRLTWELPEEKAVFAEDKGEQPFILSKDYTLSLYEKANLRHDLEAWRGRAFTETELQGFDIFSIIGVAGLITVIHKATDKGKTFANVSSITALPKGMKCPAIINPPLQYSVSEGDSEVFRSLPEWLRKKIQGCLEWGDTASQPAAAPDEDPDSVPF